MTDIEFPKGIIFKLPPNNAPDYVRGKISIKIDEAIEWLQSKEEEWVNLELLESKQGKAYCKVDNWKPNTDRQKPATEETESPEEDLPF